jgi:uncharacterized integral membrane protein (TIGR00698 family)
LPVTLGTVAVALLLAPVLGRMLRLQGALRRLIGVGTAICGASAIAAVAGIIEPEEEQLTIAVATIFCYNVVAVLLFPSLGHLMHLSQTAFGLWAGTAVNDTSSVVAAGYAYGDEAGAYATIVKLTRATLIVPIVAALALMRVHSHRAAGTSVSWQRVIPWFIVWFLCAAAVNTGGLIPGAWHAPIGIAVAFLITTALAAIGLQTDVRRVKAAGVAPLALGFLLWAAVALSSLAIAHAVGG